MTNKNETTKPVEDKNKKTEKKNTGIKTAAAVAGGVVVGNLAWGLGLEGKEAVEEYIAEMETEEEIQEVLAVVHEENTIVPDTITGESEIEAANVSDVVTDDMSFSEAFAAARADVGAGGVFEWNGDLFGTYYKEEWEDLSPAETEEYWASVEAAEIDIEQEAMPDELYAEADTAAGQDHTDDFTGLDDPNDDLSEDMGDAVVGTEDLDGDGYEESVLFDADQDGEIDMVASDTTGDGQIDYVVADTDGDGEADLIAEDTDGDGEVDVIAADTTGDGEFDHYEEVDNEDLLANKDESDIDPSGDADFDNDANMSEWA